VLRNLEIALKN